MRGLTVCQPYAELIARGVKPIENRTWATPYRGEVVIHAGKSIAWLSAEDIAEFPKMLFGAALAIARLHDCVEIRKLPVHLQNHPHANGPFCWLLENVRRLPTPVLWRGAQGLWHVEPALERAIRDQFPETHP